MVVDLALCGGLLGACGGIAGVSITTPRSTLALRNRFSVCVGYPKIARHDVKKSTLNITSMVLSDPKPDSFALNQSQTLNTDSHFHPWIFGFNANVSLAGAPRPFTSVHVPKVKSKDGAVIEIVQRVNASDMDSFADFAKTVLTREEFEMIIQGKTKLKQGGLQNVSIDYNKTVKMKGMFELWADESEICTAEHRLKLDVRFKQSQGLQCHGVPYLAEARERTQP